MLNNSKTGDLILEKVITENNKLIEDNTVFLKENIEYNYDLDIS